MKAMVLQKLKQPLVEQDVPIPPLHERQVLIEVSACAVCRTDLHIMDGELPESRLPRIPGHEVVGRIRGAGPGADRFAPGTRVGVPWLGWTCGSCRYCSAGLENLCDRAQFTGYTLDGGYAQFTVADERFCVPIPEAYDDVSAAPLLCAGLIGYRSLAKCGEAESIGIYGFGAAAHIITQVANRQGRRIYAFTRGGDIDAQEFARSLGAVWAGPSEQRPPADLDAAIVFAPVGALVPAALASTRKGGVVVCGGIHMSDIPSFPYELLWGERRIESVANLTRRDSDEFMRLAGDIRIQTHVQPFALEKANDALNALRSGKLQGAAVLVHT